MEVLLVVVFCQLTEVFPVDVDHIDVGTPVKCNLASVGRPRWREVVMPVMRNLYRLPTIGVHREDFVSRIIITMGRKYYLGI